MIQCERHQTFYRRARTYILLRKTKSFYNEDLTRQEKKTRDDAEGRRRFFSDRNTSSFSLLLPPFSLGRTMPQSRERRTRGSHREEGKNRTRGSHIAVTSRTCFGQHAHGLARSQRHRRRPSASPTRFHPDSDANRGQLRRCVPSLLYPRARGTASTSIEITLIYCGTERLARSIIRLSSSQVAAAKSLAFSLPSMDRPSLAGLIVTCVCGDLCADE